MRGDGVTRIEVCADWVGLSEPTRMGELSVALGRGGEVFSFQYDSDWLRSGRAQQLDPSLRLYGGPQYPASGRANFGLFLDSSPDRWGRLLMVRRETLAAKDEKRAPRTLRDSDYLLGVHDAQRMGGLRFRTDPRGPYLAAGDELACPPWTSLRELEQASSAFEAGDPGEGIQYRQWLRVLMAPGSSLGGARPKAGVRGTDGNLWIAKFPSRNDLMDCGAWEWVTHQLAREAGIDVSESHARKLCSDHHTFLTRRFDRTADGKRVHFASAMTLLGRGDGDGADTGASYLELAEYLEQHGSNPSRDLQQLWRRIVFSICVSNCDDHLRNHGFLLRQKGWALAPAYDMNPNPGATGLHLNIDGASNALDLGLAYEVAELFRVTPSGAKTTVDGVVKAVSQWRLKATRIGIPRSEQEYMGPAFRAELG